MGAYQPQRQFPTQSPTYWGSVWIELPAALNPGRKKEHRLTLGFYRLYGKRVVDFLGAVVALVVASPIFIVCAVAICLDSRGPIFYRQLRVGQAGRPFRLFKLRTMVQGADKQGSKLTASGDPRITLVGRLLRKMKLDELPQLLNVLLGHMSLVGPRPEVPEYTAKYTREEQSVLEVKPGVTGAASVAYADEARLLAKQLDKETFYVNVIMRHKLEIDLAYCQNINLTSDIRILLQTFYAVLVPCISAFKSTKATPSTDEELAV